MGGQAILWGLGVMTVLAAGEVRGQAVLLDKGGRPRKDLQDVVALLEPLERRAPVPPRPLLEIRTVGKRFVPRVALTTPGSEISFPNLDPILHNVFSLTPANPFDTGQYLPGDSPRVRVRQPGLVKLYCNVHPQMAAFLWVVETPWARVLPASGEVHFTGVPEGTYRLRLWHPEAGERSWTLGVGAGKVQGEWVLEVDRPAYEPHKNKFGKDYPPARDERIY